MTEHWDIERYRAHLVGDKPKKKASKYSNQVVWIDNIRFASILEGAYYLQLCCLQKAGDVEYFLMQVKIECGGGVKYWVDFLVFYVGHHRPAYIDVKGKKTRAFKNKKKQVEAYHPIEIQCRTKDDVEDVFKRAARAYLERPAGHSES